MAWVSSQSHFAWLCKFPYWASSGLLVTCWFLPAVAPAFAANTAQNSPTPLQAILADGHEEATEEGAESEPRTIPPPPSQEEDSNSSAETDSPLKPDPDLTAPLPQVDPELPEPPQRLPIPLRQPDLPGSEVQNFILGNPEETLDFDTYRLGPGDSFFVSVPRFPDLSFQATLDIQGNVIVPLEGVTRFSGLTLQGAEEALTRIYSRYVENPETGGPAEVGVTLVAQRGVEVTVLGEVVQPGFYPLAAPQISTALLSAGGTTGEADLRKVVIQRRLPGGDFQEEVFDLFTPLKEGQEIPNVALQDGDVIVVEQLDPAVLDEYDRDLVARSTIARPNITVRILNYGGGSLGGTTGGNLTALELPNGSRFADVLVRAGLNPDTSNLREIGLVRFDEEAGQAVTLTLDGNEAFRGDPSENPPLQNNDVVIVNRTLLARITYAFNVFTQPFRDVLGFILFFDSLAESANDLFAP
ncbi:MAG: polysaccharide biosynthesis/export family protein [Leptolyngbyaceae cyanobacterium]